MNCVEIIRKYLKDNGFDGLYNDDGCCCGTENLVPCSEDFSYCLPGYLIIMTGGLYDQIGPDKPKEAT